MTRIPCAGRSCKRSRLPKGEDIWPHWLCPACWAKVREAAKIEVKTLRDRLGSHHRNKREEAFYAVHARLIDAWRSAVNCTYRSPLSEERDDDNRASLSG